MQSITWKYLHHFFYYSIQFFIRCVLFFVVVVAVDNWGYYNFYSATHSLLRYCIRLLLRQITWVMWRKNSSRAMHSWRWSWRKNNTVKSAKTIKFMPSSSTRNNRTNLSFLRLSSRLMLVRCLQRCWGALSRFIIVSGMQSLCEGRGSSSLRVTYEGVDDIELCHHLARTNFCYCFD